MAGQSRMDQFVQTMGSSLNPVPARGFRVRPRLGHVVDHGLPRVLEKVSKKTERQINCDLPKENREELIRQLARRKALLILKQRTSGAAGKMRDAKIHAELRDLIRADEDQ